MRPAGLRDRALIALLTYSFARVGAARQMRVKDVCNQQRRLWVRLHEKGGNRHEIPCYHSLKEYLVVAAASGDHSLRATGFTAGLNKRTGRLKPSMRGCWGGQRQPAN